MGIINTQRNQEIELTKEQQLSRVRSRIVARNTQAFTTLKRSMGDNWKDVWANEDGLTPQEVIGSFETDGGKLVQVSAITAQLINAIVPNSVPDAAPQPLTVNPDGTVVVGETEGD